MIVVVEYDGTWPAAFAEVASTLGRALAHVDGVGVEHVGSTSVPGLAAKPILDVDVLVDRGQVEAAVTALTALGYRHRGDLGVADREAFLAPDEEPARNVYICVRGTLHVRNHLAVRSVLRRNTDLREEYAAVKWALAADPAMGIDGYLAGKSAVLQKVLAESDLTAADRLTILQLNDPSA